MVISSFQLQIVIRCSFSSSFFLVLSNDVIAIKSRHEPPQEQHEFSPDFVPSRSTNGPTPAWDEVGGTTSFLDPTHAYPLRVAKWPFVRNLPPHFRSGRFAIEVGANGHWTLQQELGEKIKDESEMPFILTFEPLLDKYAFLLGKYNFSDVAEVFGRTGLATKNAVPQQKIIPFTSDHSPTYAKLVEGRAAGWTNSLPRDFRLGFSHRFGMVFPFAVGCNETSENFHVTKIDGCSSLLQPRGKQRFFEDPKISALLGATPDGRGAEAIEVESSESGENITMYISEMMEDTFVSSGGRTNVRQCHIIKLEDLAEKKCMNLDQRRLWAECSETAETRRVFCVSLETVIGEWLLPAWQEWRTTRRQERPRAGREAETSAGGGDLEVDHAAKKVVGVDVFGIDTLKIDAQGLDLQVTLSAGRYLKQIEKIEMETTCGRNTPLLYEEQESCEHVFDVMDRRGFYRPPTASSSSKSYPYPEYQLLMKMAVFATHPT